MFWHHKGKALYDIACLYLSLSLYKSHTRTYILGALLPFLVNILNMFWHHKDKALYDIVCLYLSFSLYKSHTRTYILGALVPQWLGHWLLMQKMWG